MEYQQLGPRRLRVALTREELEELGLSYDALDYRDLRTRSLLLTLLETARGAVEFEAGGRILVEVAPAGATSTRMRPPASNSTAPRAVSSSVSSSERVRRSR